MPKCGFNKFALRFDMGVFLYIYCAFLEHFCIRTPLDGSFWRFILDIWLGPKQAPEKKLSLSYLVKI